MTLPSSLLRDSFPLSLIEPQQHRPWPQLDDECKQAVARVLDRGILSGSYAPEALAFQEEFAQFVEARHALLTHSGTSALVIALAAAGIGPGDEVIVPAYTFVATPLAVAACGATPLFADVDPHTGLMTTAEAEAWITPRTKGFLPVHVHGCPFDVDDFQALAQKIGAVVIEDAAQAHGATYKKKKVGALGLSGGFSLQSSKNLGAGEGGVFVTNEESQAELANQVRNFGQDLKLSDARLFDPKRPLDGLRPLQSTRPGSMYRGNEMLAALARVLLRQLPERTALCQHNAERLSSQLRQLPGVLPPTVPEDRSTVHHKYRVRIDRRAAELEDFTALQVREALVSALRQTGFEVTLWERHAQTAQQLFSQHTHLPEHVRENYQNVFPHTQSLLDESFLFFTQSYPLIAQTTETVEAYGRAFARIWEHRRAIVESYVRAHKE